MTKDKGNLRTVSIRWSALLLLIVSGLLISSCVASGIRAGEEVMLEKTTFSFDQDKKPFGHLPEYHIAPGDILDVLFQIRTWIQKEEFRLAIDHEVIIKFVYNPELNEQQLVRPDGTISLPYLGEVNVIGKTLAELKGELKDRYSKILKNPELYVVVPQFRSAIKELKRDLHTAPRGLSRLVTVRPDGYVTFPMVGDMFVAGRTVPDVSTELNNRYKDILPDLHCDLFLEKHAGSVIYVVGEVNSPGAYKILRPVSILEALTLAKNFTRKAKLESVIVVRKHEERLVATKINFKDSLYMREDVKFFYLQPDDIVYVPKTYISQAAEVANDIADILLFRGWSVGFDWELRDEQPR